MQWKQLVTDENNKKTAVQISYEYYGELIDDLLVRVNIESRREKDGYFWPNCATHFGLSVPVIPDQTVPLVSVWFVPIDIELKDPFGLICATLRDQV